MVRMEWILWCKVFVALVHHSQAEPSPDVSVQSLAPVEIFKENATEERAENARLVR